MTEKRGYVYLLASQPYGTLYIGVTSDLIKRIWQHKAGEIEGFTKRYKVNRLVYYEIFDTLLPAIEREKKLKKYKRDYKINLINNANPHWSDLYESLI